MLLAVVGGGLAGVGTYLFEMLLYGIKYGLTNWFPVDLSLIHISLALPTFMMPPPAPPPAPRDIERMMKIQTPIISTQPSASLRSGALPARGRDLPSRHRLSVLFSS